MDGHERAGQRSTDDASDAEGSRNIGGSRNSMAGNFVDSSRRGLPVQDPSHSLMDKDNQDGFSPYFLAAAAAAAASAQAEAAARSTDSMLISTPTKRDGPTSSNPSVARPYTDSQSPFPMSSSGNRRTLNHSLRDTSTSKEQASRKHFDRVRCSWAILSTTVTDELHFLYADPSLRRSIRKEYDDTSFFSYIHPEDQRRTRADLKNIVESRTLFGSVTRCRFRPSPPSSSSSPRSGDSSKNGDENGYTAIDIVVNWIGDDMALCFLHAIMDESAQDNDEVNKTSWSNWCGVGEGGFGQEECQGIWRSIQSHRTLKATTTGPSCVFQILSAVTSTQVALGTGAAAAAAAAPDVLFSWPPPRLFVSESTSSAAQINIKFADGSYFVDDFARLAQGVDKLTKQKELSDASTSCTRRFRARHTLTTEGMVRSVESVLIPYGSIVLACFRVTHAQMLPDSEVMDATVSSAPRQYDAGVDRSLSSPASTEGQDEARKSNKREQGQKRAENQVPAASLKVVLPQKKETRATRVGKGGATASSPTTTSTKSCQNCGRKDSPEWRKGRDGKKSLCNACGLRYARNVARAKKREERARLANEVAMNGGIIPAHLLKKAQTDKEERKAKKRKKEKERQEGAEENRAGGARTINDIHKED